jgi:hypothetical protein
VRKLAAIMFSDIVGYTALMGRDEEDKKISDRQISDIQAYEYYLKAKSEINSWTESGMERALGFLEKGLEITGDNVLLYYGMGWVYWTYINIGFKNKEECIVNAEKYVKKYSHWTLIPFMVTAFLE